MLEWCELVTSEKILNDFENVVAKKLEAFNRRQQEMDSCCRHKKWIEQLVDNEVITSDLTIAKAIKTLEL